MRPDVTLTVVTSADGFIARWPGESPAAWASPEEQALFVADVAAADWAVMGRGTHEAADRPQRRRVVFSSAAGAGEWRRPVQLWLDPAGLSLEEIAAQVEAVHPMRRVILLGGTRVHDWFLARGAIDRVHLTVEPVRFGSGLPVFSGGAAEEPLAIFERAGFAAEEERVLNAAGTRWLRLLPR